MPIFSFWATGVITYEMTMLGAIVATFAWFLWESGLVARRDRSAPVPQVDPGSICLRVRCQAGARPRWQSIRCAAPARSACSGGARRDP